MRNQKSVGVTFSQAIRSCGINCPPNLMFSSFLSQYIRATLKKRLIGIKTPIGINCPPKEQKTFRALKIFYRNEYKRHLLHLKYIKLTLMQDKAFCPLYI